jgi:hypothetical protein
VFLILTPPPPPHTHTHTFLPQHVGDEPVYPEGCEQKNESKEPLPIVRNPGPVRDIAVPFSHTLKTDSLKNKDGWASFVRTVDDCKSNKDPDVRLISVPWCSTFRTKQSNPVKLAKTLMSESWRERALAFDIPYQNMTYGCCVAKELEYLREEYNKECNAQGDTSSWAACVAVLVPGVPQELSGMLLAATREAAERKGYADVLAALPEGESPFDQRSMYVLTIHHYAVLSWSLRRRLIVSHRRGLSTSYVHDTVITVF